MEVIREDKKVTALSRNKCVIGEVYSRPKGLNESSSYFLVVKWNDHIMFLCLGTNTLRMSQEMSTEGWWHEPNAKLHV